jgi:acyl-homoserine lactone synthase
MTIPVITGMRVDHALARGSQNGRTGAGVMIKSFVGVEAAANPAIFEDLFRLRHEIYIVRRKWGALHAEDGLERDSYDNSDAVYLIGLSGEGKVNCGLRLLPTTVDHLFRDHFLHLAPAGLPQGDGVYELTRFFIATTRVAARHRQRMIAILGAALFEYCLAHGIETIICVTDAFLTPTMQSLHWRPRPLGLPSKYPEGTAIGVAIEISEDTLDRLRATHGIDGAVLDEPLDRALLAASLPAQMH